MYVNIKILAAFPWFQALNVLVILTLSHRQRRGAAHREPRMLHRDKASEVPAPSALASASLSPGSAASTATKSLRLQCLQQEPCFSGRRARQGGTLALDLICM